MSDSELDAGCKQDYGRLNFRGVTMAYLILGDQKRFTLTDVVCNLYPLTPRTTVISRMDKMNIVRTPCTPEQIRKLKAARGVHSSSVVCSLVSKQAIEDFCEKYPIDIRVGPDSTVVTGKEESAENINKVNKKPGKKINAVLNHCKDKTVLAKKRRSKKNTTDFSCEKRANTAVKNHQDSIHILNTDGAHFHSLSFDSCIGSFTTNDHNQFCRSFEASNHVESKTKKTKQHSITSKGTISKLSKPIKNGHFPTKRRKLSDSNEGNALVRKVKKVKLKHSDSKERLVINDRSLSTTNKHNSQWWLHNFSETSSHSFSPSKHVESPSHENSTASKNKELFSTPKKNSSVSTVNRSSKDIHRLNASPPSLILKRQGKRTWQVEQRTTDKPVNKMFKLNSCLDDQDCTFSPKKKEVVKGYSDQPVLSTAMNIKKEGINSDQQTLKTEGKTRKSKNSKKKPDIVKGSEVKKKKIIKKDVKCNGQSSYNCTGTSHRNTTFSNQEDQNPGLGLKRNKLQLKKKRKKRKVNIKQESFSRNNDEINMCLKGKVTKLKKIKSEPLFKSEIEYECSEQKYNIDQFPTPDSTPSATPTEIKPSKVVKITPVKSKLKANAKFKFMNIFSTEPSLTMKNGELVPAYNLCPDHDQKTLLSSISTWRIGGSVVGRSNIRYKVHK